MKHSKNLDQIVKWTAQIEDWMIKNKTNEGKTENKTIASVAENA